jgi:eukaryotic-like serine/threonine-protein kinase
MNRFKRLVTEVHRRSLWQVLSIYLVASWVGYQVITELTERIGLPAWVPGFAIVLFFIGLPIVLATAFIQEGAPKWRSTIEFEPTDPTLFPQSQSQSQAPSQSNTDHFFFTWKKAIAGGIVAFLLLGITAGGYMGLRNAGIGPFGSLLAKGALENRERILVADFNDISGDTMLAQAVTQAFRVSFAQSNVVTVLEPNYVREVLARMERNRTDRLDAELAREVAQRDNIKAYVVGDIARVGGKFSLSGKLLSASDGVALASFSETAADSSELLPAVDKLSAALREKIGESLRNVNQTRPLAAVTTASLAALRKYSQAELELDGNGDTERGIALLKEALALDTSFAMGWRKLAVAYSNSGAPFNKIMDAATRAYQHRDRLPELERYLTIAYYNTSITEDLTQARDAYLNALEIQPANFIALNNLGILYSRLRDKQQARAMYEKVIAVQPNRVNPYTNLAEILVDLNKLDSAEVVLKTMQKTTNSPASLYDLMVVQIAQSRRDYAAVEKIATGITQNQSAREGHRNFSRWMLAANSMVQGKFSEAQRRADAARATDKTRESPPDAFEVGMQNAELDVAVRQNRETALRKAEQALASGALEKRPAEDRPYLWAARVMAMAGRPDQSKQLISKHLAQSKEIRGDDRDRLSLTQGWVALAEGHYPQAIENFRQASELGGCMRCDHFELALAFEAANQPDSAIAHYEYWVNQPQGDAPIFNDAAHLHAAYEHLADLYEQKGNKPKAAHYAAKFVELWQNADAELQPRVQAKRAMLQRLAQESVP